jgi:hypothetical protein
MQQYYARRMKDMKIGSPKLVCLVGLLAPVWLAGMARCETPAPAVRGSNGYIARLDRAVGLRPEQRDAVRGMLSQQREKTQSIRTETDAKIRAVLSPDQQKRYDAFQTESQARRNRAH